MSDTPFDEFEQTEAKEAGTVIAALSPTSISLVIAADEKDILGALFKEIDGFDPDISTKAGRDEIASKAYKVTKAKTALIEIAKGLKSGPQATIKALNGEIDVIEERTAALRDQIRRPLDEYEAKEKAIDAAHEAALLKMAKTADFDGPEPSVAEIDARLLVLAEVFGCVWGVFEKRAAATHATALSRLNSMRTATILRDEKRAEEERVLQEAKERIRQNRIRERAEEDKQIAEQAAEQARAAAERKAADEAQLVKDRADAEQRRADRVRRELEERAAHLKEVARQAEVKRLAAIEQARVDAEAAEAEAERKKDAAIQAERDRVAAEAEELAQEAAARAADIAHKGKIDQEAITALISSAALTQEQARAAIKAISRNLVPHVSIGY